MLQLASTTFPWVCKDGKLGSENPVRGPMCRWRKDKELFCSVDRCPDLLLTILTILAMPSFPEGGSQGKFNQTFLGLDKFDPKTSVKNKAGD